MSAIAQSGLDLYARDPDGKWKWAGASREIDFPKSQCTLLSDAAPEMREYMLYLPLTNPVANLQIGVCENSSITAAPERGAKPIAVYGTSIVNGIGASRPGMVYSSILSRWLNREIINLGFSGNAHMEMELADLLAELDPCLYILDAAPNMNAELIDSKAENFIKRIHEAKADIPIILMEDRDYGSSWIVKQQMYENKSRKQALRQVFDKLKAAGIQNIYYVYGTHLLGDDTEATVDSSHPTDLGHFRIAENLFPVIEQIINT
jgi:hypothetical protein